MAKPETFPIDAKLNRVMGIVRFLHRSSKKLSIAELTELSGQNVDTLLPQVSAASMLGLISIKAGEVMLTATGEGFFKNDEKAMASIRKRLAALEPFKTALAMSMRVDAFTTHELAEELREKGVSWHTEKHVNLEILNTLLIQWAIFFGIIDYDGKSRVWLKEAA